MPGPPPPPPPGGPPPPPPTFSMPVPTSAPDDRSALLTSIRKGTKLKKTVTVDKSAPVIQGKSSSVNNSNTSSNSTNDRSQLTGSPMINGLGALFPDGIPKLKPIKSSGIPPNSTSNNNNFVNTQKQIKMQIRASDNKNRGPPPPAPTRNASNTEIDSTSRRIPLPTKNSSSNTLQLNTSVPNIPECNIGPNKSTLHKKAISNINLGTLDNTDLGRNNNSSKSNSFGKPHIAPKPSPLNGKPNLKRASLNRTQSMHSPRSPSPQGTAINDKMKFGTVRNLKPGFIDSLENIHHSSRPSMAERPKAPPPSIPHTPPPPSKVVIKHPGHAPPPPPPSVMLEPPSQAPPPPPHRTPPQIARTVPPPPISNGSGAPTPPPRFSSMKDVGDFEARFSDKFHDVNEFPPPMPFKGTEKLYTGLRVGSNKQQAPLPPNHIQLNNRLWNSSTC